MQHVLADLTGCPPPDQILTHEGAPLSPGNYLSDYGLAGPEDGEGRARDVFLYSKSLLRPDAATPAPETFPEPPENITASHAGVTRGEDEGGSPHPLDSAPSPLLRALPEYQRQFRGHLLEVENAVTRAMTYVALSCRLLNEAEVQAMAVDAAMASVEPHYAFICNAQATFQQRFNRRYAAHQDVLSTFDADVEFLNSVELPPQLQTEGVTKLSDLVNLEDLRGVAAECRRSHRRFASRVAELESLHAALRADVEALFMRAPSVDLDALAQGLSSAEAASEEVKTSSQALASDCRRADTAVEDAMREVLFGLQDVVGMLEAMHESHVTSILPRVRECSAFIEQFAKRCLEAKNALAMDALRTLRTIASQQSKIREMREALAPFPGALDRQDAQISRLLIIRRLPAAYKQALAECVRRAAFAEKYTAFAVDLAERMGKFRLKEAAMRDKFRSHVVDHLPLDILERMGLHHPPPHCHVNVPGEEAALLLPVTPEDLRRLQLPRYSSTTASSLTGGGTGGTAAGIGTTTSSTAVEQRDASSTTTTTTNMPSSGSAGAGYSSTHAAVDLSSATPGASPVASGAAQLGRTVSSPGTTSSLQLQNAQLRAELASQIALSCIQAAELAALGPLPTSSATTTTEGPQISGDSSSGGSSAGAGGSTSVSTNATTTTPGRSVSFGQQPGGFFLGPEAVQKFERALAAKDALIATFKEEAEKEAGVLQRRITELESRLGSVSAAEVVVPENTEAPLLSSVGAGGEGVSAAAAIAEKDSEEVTTSPSSSSVKKDFY